MTFSAGINGFHDSEWFRIPTCPACFLSLWCHSKNWSDPQPEMIYRIFLHRFNRMNVQLSWVCFRWWCVFPMEIPPCGDFFHHANQNPFLRSYWIPPPKKIWFPTESIHVGSTEVLHIMGIGVLGNWSRNQFRYRIPNCHLVCIPPFQTKPRSQVCVKYIIYVVVEYHLWYLCCCLVISYVPWYSFKTVAFSVKHH